MFPPPVITSKEIQHKLSFGVPLTVIDLTKSREEVIGVAEREAWSNPCTVTFVSVWNKSFFSIYDETSGDPINNWRDAGTG